LAARLHSTARRIDAAASYPRATISEIPVDKHQQRLAQKLDRLASKLPRCMASGLRWLRRPSSRWLRLPTGLLLIVGGAFSILPLLGLWMLPLGLLLLVQDVPFLRQPTRRALTWVQRYWQTWRRKLRRAKSP